MRDFLAEIPHDIRIFAAVTAAVLIAAVLLTVLVVLLTREPTQAVDSDAVSRLRIDRTEFMLPDESVAEPLLDQTRFRFPQKSWSSVEIDELWVDPVALGKKILSERNREKIERILAEAR